MSPYTQQKGKETSHLLANPEVLEISFISTCPKATNRIPETEKIVLIPQNTTAAAAAAAAAAAVVVVVVVVVVVAVAAAKKILPTVQAAVAVAAAAAAAKNIMRNINPITQETFEYWQSKAIRGSR